MFELNPSKTVNDTGSACAVPVSVGTRLPGNDWSERKELVMKNASLMVVAVALLVADACVKRLCRSWSWLTASSTSPRC